MDEKLDEFDNNVPLTMEQKVANMRKAIELAKEARQITDNAMARKRIADENSRNN